MAAQSCGALLQIGVKDFTHIPRQKGMNFDPVLAEKGLPSARDGTAEQHRDPSVEQLPAFLVDSQTPGLPYGWRVSGLAVPEQQESLGNLIKRCNPLAANGNGDCHGYGGSDDALCHANAVPDASQAVFCS